jgi:hypothetical protein
VVPPTFDEHGRRRQAPGTADNEPAELADEAGSQPTGTGGCYLNGHSLSVRRLFHHVRTFVADECAIPGLDQKTRIDEGPEQRRANVAFETPEPASLCRRQSQTRHFYELALNPLENFIDTHTDLR